MTSSAAPFKLVAPSPQRRWAFRLAAVALPFGFLALLEIGLRLAGYGYDPDFFRLTQDQSGKSFWINNDQFTFRFFPPELSRCPPPFRIATEKPAGTRRIFVMGESAAMGDPQPSVGPARILEVLLRERFPEESFEVINLGITAINSHVILPLAREVAARGAGDVWILYLGNNEMVGPFGAATVFGNQAAPLALIRGHLAWQRLRLGQLTVALLGKHSGASQPATWGGMQMFLEQQVPPDDSRRTIVQASFAQNLRDIVTAGLGANAQIVLSTVAVNLRDCPPFGSLHARSLAPEQQAEFERHYTNGVTQAMAALSPAAEESFARAAAIDADFAALQFQLGKCVAGRSAVLAREHFQRACDADSLPFRADTRINQTIRAIGKEFAGERLQWCDAAAVLDQAGDGVAGAESFFEHVHFNFDGNYRVALAWAESVAALMPAAVRRNARTNWAAQELCERVIGLSDWNRRVVISTVLARIQQPPLRDQITNPERAAALRQELRVIAERTKSPESLARVRGAFEQALASRPGDVFLRENWATFLRLTDAREAAVAEYRTMLKLVPQDFYTRIQLGRLCGELGRLTEAERELQQAAAQRPFLPDAWFELGVVQALANKQMAALASFDRVLAMQPNDVAARLQRARVLAKLDRRAEAIAGYRSVIATHPERWEPHVELAELLAGVGDFRAAVPEYQAAVALNPRHAGVRLNYGTALARVDRLEEALVEFRAVLVLTPTNAVAQQYLREVTAWREQRLRAAGGLTH